MDGPRGLQGFRKRKVLAVRRRLAEGRYAVNERISVALDRLIEDIMVGGGTRVRQLPSRQDGQLVP
ncbi:MAG: hypothetical protein ABIF19_07445 [Planctomycetota bacterium]